MNGYRYGCNPQVMSILHRLTAGSLVSIWFDDSKFLTSYFQFLRNDEAAFSGGSLDGGLTYIKLSNLKAVKVGSSNEPKIIKVSTY